MNNAFLCEQHQLPLEIVCQAEQCISADKHLLCIECKQDYHIRHKCAHVSTIHIQEENTSLIEQLQDQQKKCIKLITVFKNQINQILDNLITSTNYQFNEIIPTTNPVNHANPTFSIYKQQIKRSLQKQPKLSTELLNKAQLIIRDVAYQLNLIQPDSLKKETSKIIQTIDNQVQVPTNKFQHIHGGLKLVGDNVIQADDDGLPTKMALLKEFADSLPLHEKKWTFQILKCNSHNQNYPMAVGLCYQKQILANKLKFAGESDIAKDKNREHGCVLVSSMGRIRSCMRAEEDGKQSDLRYMEGDVVELRFSPFMKCMIVSRGNESVQVSLLETRGFQLVPCIRLGYESVRMLN